MSFDRYLSAESGITVTTFLPGPRRFATWAAAHTTAPAEEPASTPHSAASRRTHMKALASGTLMISSARSRSMVGWMTLMPMPSTS